MTNIVMYLNATKVCVNVRYYFHSFIDIGYINSINNACFCWDRFGYLHRDRFSYLHTKDWLNFSSIPSVAGVVSPFTWIASRLCMDCRLQSRGDYPAQRSALPIDNLSAMMKFYRSCSVLRGIYAQNPNRIINTHLKRSFRPRVFLLTWN